MKDYDNQIVYTIKPFMRELGIKNSTLTVYALLYAFTKGKAGMYYGRRRYLYETAMICQRTCERAIAELFSKGLIEHCESADGRYKGIRCVDIKKVREAQAAEAKAEMEARLNAEKEKQDVGEYTHPIWTRERREAAYGRVISSSFGVVSPDEKRLLVEEYMSKGLHPESKFLNLGVQGRVRMTEEQYKSLTSLINASELHTYITRLENMLIKNEETGFYCNKGHYSLIREWIKKDMHV